MRTTDDAAAAVELRLGPLARAVLPSRVAPTCDRNDLQCWRGGVRGRRATGLPLARVIDETRARLAERGEDGRGRLRALCAEIAADVRDNGALRPLQGEAEFAAAVTTLAFLELARTLRDGNGTDASDVTRQTLELLVAGSAEEPPAAYGPPRDVQSMELSDGNESVASTLTLPSSDGEDDQPSDYEPVQGLGSLDDGAMISVQRRRAAYGPPQDQPSDYEPVQGPGSLDDDMISVQRNRAAYDPPQAELLHRDDLPDVVLGARHRNPARAAQLPDPSSGDFDASAGSPRERGSPGYAPSTGSGSSPAEPADDAPGRAWGADAAGALAGYGANAAGALVGYGAHAAAGAARYGAKAAGAPYLAHAAGAVARYGVQAAGAAAGRGAQAARDIWAQPTGSDDDDEPAGDSLAAIARIARTRHLGAEAAYADLRGGKVGALRRLYRALREDDGGLRAIVDAEQGRGAAARLERRALGFLRAKHKEMEELSDTPVAPRKTRQVAPAEYDTLHEAYEGKRAARSAELEQFIASP